jgi:MFS family permease
VNSLDTPERAPENSASAAARRALVDNASQPVSSHASLSPERFPPGLHNAFFFSVFNALSFQIVLSSPMVLYAKSLGASSTVLGIIAGMMPLLVIFQIPAANYLERVGYKRFVFGGWGMRVLMIFGIALVPVGERLLDPTTRLVLILALLFVFNLSRGISSAGWLPWITSLVPPTIRGKYLANEAGFNNLGSFGAFIAAAFALGNAPAAWQFSIVFLFSALAGSMSLVFLKRIPDVAVPVTPRTSREPVPWRAMAAFPPFRKLVALNVAWSVAFGGITTFVVAYLKAHTNLTEREILLANSMFFIGGLSSLWLMGLRLDRFGSRPVIAFSICLWLVITAGWALLAGEMFAPLISFVLALQFLMGLGNALANMAQTRLAMVVIPEMGRSHFFALYSVIGSLALGIAPVLWGLLIDSLHGLHAGWREFEWNQFSVFFAAAGVAFLVALFRCRKLEETHAADMDELLRDLLIHSPQRFWLRFWPRE